MNSARYARRSMVLSARNRARAAAANQLRKGERREGAGEVFQPTAPRAGGAATLGNRRRFRLRFLAVADRRPGAAQSGGSPRAAVVRVDGGDVRLEPGGVAVDADGDVEPGPTRRRPAR